ncbi:MAG: KilA-N domain-containing protein [Bacteroidota bacterium]
MSDKINIEGIEISIKSVNNEDYISLTDIARQRNTTRPRDVIRNWIGDRSTEDFLELWELTHNPNFKRDLYTAFKDYRFRKKVDPTIKEYLENSGAIGIISKAGRYGGTFSHSDIAFEFASWISPVFKLRMIMSYQRLMREEAQRKRIEWNAGRELSRLNAPIMTDSISQVIGSTPDNKKAGHYAAEFDMINQLVFGMTAKAWRAKNPDAKGSIRDSATATENVLIANLENLNSVLIRKGASREA